MKAYYYLGRKADSQNRNDCSKESCDCYILADDKKAAKKIIKKSGMEIIPGYRLELAIHQNHTKSKLVEILQMNDEFTIDQFRIDKDGDLLIYDPSQKKEMENGTKKDN